MKSVFYFSLILFLALSFPTPLLSAAPQSRPADSRPAGAGVYPKSMLQDAVTLLEIYGKIRKIIGQSDRSELKPYLDQLNRLLDQILSFKNSFTPKKMAKIDKQLLQLKKDILDLGNVSLKDSDKQLDKLSGSIFNLVQILLEPAPEDQM